MLDKIILSTDRHSAVVHFDTHSVNFSSDGDVYQLVFEIILEPSIRLEQRHRSAEEDTQVLDIQLSFPEVA